MKKGLRVGDLLPVKIQDGGPGQFEVVLAKIRRIAPYSEAHQGFRMMTLDIGGSAAHAVCREEEVADGG